MANFELFDRTCALILAKLFEKHPIPVEEFRDHELELFNDKSISDETCQKRKIVSESIVFLKTSGYITYQGAYGSDTGIPKYEMKLTAKGLSALRNTPDGMEIKGKSIGELLMSRAQGLSSVALDEVLKHVIKMILS